MTLQNFDSAAKQIPQARSNTCWVGIELSETCNNLISSSVLKSCKRSAKKLCRPKTNTPAIPSLSLQEKKKGGNMLITK